MGRDDITSGLAVHFKSVLIDWILFSYFIWVQPIKVERACRGSITILNYVRYFSVSTARATDLTYQTRMEKIVALRARHWLYHIRSFLLEIASLLMTEIADSPLRWSFELILWTTTHTYFVSPSLLHFFIITVTNARFWELVLCDRLERPRMLLVRNEELVAELLLLVF